MARFIDADQLRAVMYHEAFEKDSDWQKWDGGCWIRYKMFETCIEAIPTVDVRENFKGKWIEKEVIHEVEASTAIDEWQSAKCSVCGKYHTTPFLYYFEDFNFCPNCGADLRGEQDG